MATVTAELGSGTDVTLKTREFTWFSDEPEALGGTDAITEQRRIIVDGTDAGPTPYEILVASLAACTAVTLRLYANHKEIPLHSVSVTSTFDRVHADDCEDCDERADGVIERIQTRVAIRGEFDDAQRARLAQVAQRCPVHKTLTNGTHISDSVSFE
ncbi:MAG: OsmC family protein [Gemmatimonadota bacterium]